MAFLKYWKGMFALITSILLALSYFARQSDLEALAGDLQKTSQQVSFQSALQLVSFLEEQARLHPNDPNIARRLKEARIQLELLRCEIWPQTCRKG